MFLLGLIVAICFVPGYTGATIPTQWAVLSIALPLSLWRRGESTSLHKLGLVFVAYALILTLRSPNHYTAVLGVWYVLIWALSFRLGSCLFDLNALWHGLASGVSISCIVAIFQALGYHPVLTAPEQIAGLYFNSTVLGAVCALMLVACIVRRIYLFIPFLATGLLLSHSRGAILVTVVGLASRIHWLLSLTLALGVFAALPFLNNPSDLQRLEIWGEAIRHLSILGWGPDSFNDLYALLPRRPWMTLSLYHLEYVHNDYLQLTFEFGIAAIIPITLLALALSRPAIPDSAVVWSFATLGLFYFPLYTPLTAFIGCMAVGHLLRDYDPLRHLGDRQRYDILPRCPNSQPATDRPWVSRVPMVTRTSHTEA